MKRAARLYSLIFLLALGGLVCSSNLWAQPVSDPRVGKITEGEFAADLVQQFGLQDMLPAAAGTDDYIAVLERLGASPLPGWDSGRILAQENYLVIMAKLGGQEKTVFELANKYCKENVDLINQAGGVSAATQYTCPWHNAYRDRNHDGKVDYHHHRSIGFLPVLKDPWPGKGGKPAPKKEGAKSSNAFLSRFKVGGSLELATEYEDNALLVVTKKEDDYKFALRPSLNATYNDGPWYFSSLGALDLVAYGDLQEWVDVWQTNGRLGYYPSKGFSAGVQDGFVHSPEQLVPTILGDTLLQLGYNNNTFKAGAVQPWTDKVSTQIDYNLDSVNYSNSSIDAPVDRIANEIKIENDLRLCPSAAGYGGYKLKRVDFTDADNKSAYSHVGFFGLRHKLTGILNWWTEFGVEQKDFFKNNLRRSSHADGLQVETGLVTTFSRFTQGSFTYRHLPLEISSGTAFPQYEAHIFEYSFRHFITPKTILQSSWRIEQQQFHESDLLFDTISTQVFGGKLVNLRTWRMSVRRILGPNLSAEVGFNRSVRDSNFVGDGYTDKRVFLALRATF